MSGAKQKLIGTVICRRCKRTIQNPKNIRLWEQNGGYGHGCFDKMKQEQAKERALNASMDSFTGLSIEQILSRDRAKEISIKRGIFSEV